jgi:GNAT superfamily N-acetyltransferase
VKAARSAPGHPAGSPAGSPPPVSYRPAAPDELTAALSLVLGSASHAADATHVLEFAQFAQHRGIDLSATWVADVGGNFAWAVLPVVSPGRTMLLLGPASAPANSVGRQIAGGLVDAVCGHFARGDVQLAQVLLDPADDAARRLHESHAFRPVAQLIYLQAAPRRKAPPPPLPPGMRWVGYGPDTHALFGRTITQTYHQSLDCPRLNGVRDIEDVLAGHKATGAFDPRLWALLCEGEAPLGALLLARAAPADMVELVYLGLTPAARGRGLGDVLMRQALASTASAGAARLSLAVDADNAPALKLYYRHGMQRVGAKLALMRRLDERADAPGRATGGGD